MFEQWKQWKPVQNLSLKYSLESVVASIEYFQIFFRDLNDTNVQLKVLFSNSVAAYRSSDETYRYQLICNLSEMYGADFYSKWTFFKVYNSTYLHWLSEQSCGISDNRELMHFSFIEDDTILDVISSYKPEFIFINRNQ